MVNWYMYTFQYLSQYNFVLSKSMQRSGTEAIRTQTDMLSWVPSQFVLKSVRTQVNSFSFWSIRTQNFGQFVLIWSIRTHAWSVRTHFGQFVLILVNSYSTSNEYELTKMSTN